MCGNWLNIVEKVLTSLGGLSILVAAITYWSQRRIRRAEWLTSLFEKFFEGVGYKEARAWLEYGKLLD
jgi:hypothetical protein